MGSQEATKEKVNQGWYGGEGTEYVRIALVIPHPVSGRAEKSRLLLFAFSGEGLKVGLRDTSP